MRALWARNLKRNLRGVGTGNGGSARLFGEAQIPTGEEGGQFDDPRTLRRSVGVPEMPEIPEMI